MGVALESEQTARKRPQSFLPMGELEKMIRKALGIAVVLTLLLTTLSAVHWTMSHDALAQGQEPAMEEPSETGSTIPAPAGGFSWEEAWNELKRQVRAGGKTVWVIIGLSLIAVAFVLERFFRLRRKNVVPFGLAQRASELWRKEDHAAIVGLCEDRRYRKTPLARIIRFLVEHRTARLDDLNNVAGDIASRHFDRHSMLNYPILTVATLAPLLGLFGTVVGMIESFDLVTLAGEMGDPRVLSGAISKALITTEFGLLVAIPTVFFYAMFRLRTSYLFNVLEEEASTLIADWFIKSASVEKSDAAT
jgi:biopolymer transport protein ExbB